MSIWFPVLTFAMLTVVAGVCWWLMARRPEQWARWVDRENSYWLGKGHISPAFAARMKRWETGWTLKYLLGATTVAAMIGLVMSCSVLAKAIALESRQLPKPYAPVFPVKPVTRPTTNRPPSKTASPAITNKTVHR